jgi:glycosyltransferase involved in cell wall biosynthesis
MAYGCYRGSKAGSLAIVASTAVHNALGTYEHKVRRYIALTEFAKNKFVEGGISAAQLDVKPNFLERDPGVGDGRGNYILYVGRLSSEKGLDVLLRAWKGLGALVPLKIAGEGPLADHCKRASSENPAIEYLGHKSLPEVLTLMGNALALVFPSLWYEGFPRTIVESLAKGTPVIASNLGSMQELIAHRRTGLHFDPYAEGSLEEQVEWMLAHVQEIRCMRLAARAEYELKYSAEKNHTMLMDIYQRAISQ